MTDGQLGTAIRRMLRTLAARESSGTSDGQLLERFTLHGDQAAFETLLWRHGLMVLSTCQRILHQAQDAEDAFQATFLVLAQKVKMVTLYQAGQ